MAAFEYRQAQEIRDVFRRHGVLYLFIGKSGAILLGYPDTTQDADLFVQRSEANCEALCHALIELGFVFTEAQAAEVKRGKDFIQEAGIGRPPSAGQGNFQGGLHITLSEFERPAGYELPIRTPATKTITPPTTT